MKALLITILAAAIICTSAFAQQELKKNYSGIKKIRMTTAAGSCKISKGGNDVEVTLRHTYDDDDRYEPRIEQEGDRLVITERFNARNVDGSSDWTLRVPDGIYIDFNTGSGNIEATALTLEFDGNTGSGDIYLTSAKGKVDCNTGSGNIELDQFDGDIKGNTGSGSIRVAKSLGDLRLNTGSGNIRVRDANASFSLNTGSGDIDAEGVTIAGASRFNTGSGTSEVSLAAAPKHDLSVNSGSGDAVLNFNGHEIAGEIVMKMDKRNGSISAPFEFDKTEEISGHNDKNITVVKTAQRGTATHRITVGTGSGDATLKK
jgi:DUF4097 and DUF4098 domain-containing protein YvlB